MNGHKLLKESGLLAKYKIDERVIPTRQQRRAVVRYLGLLDRQVDAEALQKKALKHLGRSYSETHWYKKLSWNLSFVAVLGLLQGQFAHADELLPASVSSQLSAQTRHYIPAQAAAEFTAASPAQSVVPTKGSVQSLHLLANQRADESYQQALASLDSDEFFVADNAILTVIDPGLDQWEILSDAVKAGEVLLLKEGVSPLAQIIAKVKSMGQVKVLNILSHGADGEIYLAGQRIAANNLAEHEQQLKELGALLTEDGQLQLFGCDVAKSELGKGFVTELAQITGADVAGSVNLTGSGIEQTKQPSDWDLEYFTGEQTTGVAQTFNSKRLLAYNNVLATVYTFDDIPAQPFGYMCYDYSECSAVVSDLTLRAVSSNPIHPVSIYGDYRVNPLPGQEQGLEYAGANNGGLWLTGGGVQNSGVPRSLEISKTDSSDFIPNSVKVRIWTYRSVSSTSSPDATFFEIVGLNSSNVQVASIKYESVYDDDTIDINFSNPASSVYTRNNGGYFTDPPTLTQSGSFATVHKLQFKTGPYQFGIDDLSIGPAVVNAVPVNTVAPAITGTATVGNALTGSTGSWTDADGDTLTYSRQWYRADDASGTNRIAIASATAASYTLITSDAHKYIQLVVTANDGNGGIQTANSTYTQVANSAPVNSVAPTISGTATVGNALTTTNGTWSDADGDSRSYTYQWYRADDNSGTNLASIAGANSASYTLTTSDAHKYLRVVVTANDGKGATPTATSTYTQVTNSAPVNSVAPTISGTATVGNVLSTTNGTWSDADGDGRTFTYQWYRADDNSGTNLTSIAGANNASYTLTASDAQKYLRVVVTANDGNGGATPANSGYTSAINTLPSDIALSSSSVNQSAGVNAIVGTLSSTDPDIGNTFTYTLVAGVGSTDNASFNVSGSSLRANDSSALAAGSYSVRIRTTDNNGGAFEKPFSITLVDDIAPTVTISSNKASLKAGETATVTFTLSEASNSFTVADATTSNGSLTDFAGSGTVYTATFTPAANTEADATINVGAGGFTDAAGNGNTAATPLSITLDTLAPDAPSTPVLSALSDSGVAGDNITNNTTPVFTGTAEEGSTVTLYDGTTVLGTTTATGGVWSITSSALSEGSHNITAKATDPAGNESNASVALVVTIDTTAHAKPSAPVLAAASDTGDSNSDRVTNLTTLTLQGAAGSVEANASVHARSDLEGGLTNTTANADGSWTLVVSSLSEGTHQLTIRATDVAGNQSIYSDPLTVTIDTTVPALGGVAFDQSSVTVANQSAISLSLAGAEVGTKASYSITSSNGGNTVNASGLSVSSATQSFTGINTSGLNDGTLTVSVTLTDLAGNSSTAVTNIISKDVNVPQVNSVAISSGNYAQGDVISVSITLSEDVTVSGANSTVAINIGGETRQATFVSGNNGVLLYQYTVQANDNTDGLGVIALVNGLVLNGDTIRDAGGNDATLAYAQINNTDAQVDTLAPGTAVIVTPAAAVSVNADDYTISGTHSENGVTVNLYLDANNDGVPDNALALDSAVVANGAWSLIAPLVADSANNFVVIVEDAAGNTSAPVDVSTITEDSTAPDAPFAPVLSAESDTGTSDSDGITSDTTPILNGTAEPDSTVTLTSDKDGVVGTVVADSAGNWSITATTLVDGVHQLTVTATDAAGNISVASTALEVTIDTTAPVLSAIANQSLIMGAGSSALTFTLSDETTDTSSLTLTTNSSNLAVVPLANLLLGGTDANRSITVTSLGQGVTTVTLSAEDEAGNIGTTSFTVTVATPNAAPVISGSPVLTVDAGSAYSFTPTASDPDSDAVTFSISNKPAWATFNITNGRLSGIPETSHTGTYSNIVISVSDGELTASLPAFTITVSEATDTGTPVITAPSSVTLNATALYTPVNLRQLLKLEADTDGAALQAALASLTTGGGEACCTTLPDGLNDNGVVLLAPGRHELVWTAVAAGGQSASASQVVNIRPLVSFAKNQHALRDSVATVRILLNGVSPQYPLAIPVTIDAATTAAETEYTLLETVAMFNEPGQTEAHIEVQLHAGANGGDSELVLGLDDRSSNPAVITGDLFDINSGAANRHTISLREGNVAPEVTLTLQQDERNTILVARTGGDVLVTAQVTDLNPDDTHTYDWSGSDNVLADLDGNPANNTLLFNPAALGGRYYVQLKVTDSAGASETADLYFRVVEQLPELDPNKDSNGNGIDDATEGFGDANGNGIPDYLDAMPTDNVLPQQINDTNTYLLECDPGVLCRIGQFALMGESGGVELLASDIQAAPNLQPDTTHEPVGGIFDFEIKHLPVEGQTIRVAIPQRAAIPVDAVYRKYQNGAWKDFVVNANNQLHSAPGNPGFCPPPGDAQWEPGLIAGYLCVQLTLEDGGPNDADGLVNKAIADPGGVSVRTQTEPPVDPEPEPPVNPEPPVDPKPPVTPEPPKGKKSGGAFGLMETGAVLLLLLLAHNRTRAGRKSKRGNASHSHNNDQV